MPDRKNTPDVLDFGEPDKANSIIKVIGVGGGGGNAVNHMYREGIHDVTFVLCNTDNQALNDSPVPYHLQLGKEGLGAGNKPEKARLAAEESLEDIKNMLNDGTRMTFITAGMGGGTGTGAAPVMHTDDAGTLKNVTKARGRKAALKALAQKLADTAINPAEQTVFICHGDCIEDAEYTAEQIRALTPVKDIIINYVGPVIGAHTGPGVISVFFVGTHR